MTRPQDADARSAKGYALRLLGKTSESNAVFAEAMEIELG